MRKSTIEQRAGSAGQCGVHKKELIATQRMVAKHVKTLEGLRNKLNTMENRAKQINLW